jgi:Ras family protein T1
MERGRTETVWSLLRHFGYDNNLDIREDFLMPEVNLPPGHEIELSKEGYQWLRGLFLQFSRNNSEHVLTWYVCIAILFRKFI